MCKEPRINRLKENTMREGRKGMMMMDPYATHKQ